MSLHRVLLFLIVRDCRKDPELVEAALDHFEQNPVPANLEEIIGEPRRRAIRELRKIQWEAK